MKLGLLFFLLLSAALAGCEADRTATVAHYSSHEAGRLERVLATPGGTYYLTDANYSKLRRASHSEGDAIGFDRDPDGGLAAVVGATRWPLDEGEYCWRYARPATPGDVLKGAAYAPLIVSLYAIFGFCKLFGLPIVVG